MESTRKTLLAISINVAAIISLILHTLTGFIQSGKSGRKVSKFG